MMFYNVPYVGRLQGYYLFEDFFSRRKGPNLKGSKRFRKSRDEIVLRHISFLIFRIRKYKCYFTTLKSITLKLTLVSGVCPDNLWLIESVCVLSATRLDILFARPAGIISLYLTT